MKKINKFVIFLDKIVNFIVIIFLICAIILGGYAIYDTYMVYNGANLSQDILVYRPNDGESFNIKALQEINSDICGWIRIDNTNVDYPVVIGSDNSEYLNINYKKEYSSSGCIFVDYRNNRYFEDDYTIIYGHNMKSSQMFADIKKFSNTDFFNENHIGTLYTENCVYNIEFFYYGKINAFSYNVYNVNSLKNNKNSDIISYLSNYAINSRNIEINSDDKIVLLSTCDVSGGATRNVLVGKLTISDESETITK